MKNDIYYRANQGFTATLGGEQVVIAEGELVADGHELTRILQ